MKDLKDLQAKLENARQRVRNREKEVDQLRHSLVEQQRTLDKLCRETGAREQRINVNTLRGAPSINQVGPEIAAQIRKKFLRRKEHLRDKVNKLQAKLGAKLAVNRELKAEIDSRRRARLHHLAAVRAGSAIAAFASSQ